MSKKLQKGSQYEKFDLDGDGIVSDQELKRSEHMIRLENSDKMLDQQRMLCWVSSVSSIILIVLVMSPAIPDARVEMVTALLSTYVVANLGIVATFMVRQLLQGRKKMVNDMVISCIFIRNSSRKCLL